jgi:chemotaxis protein methyltransferase CheR
VGTPKMLEDLEITLLLEAIALRFGDDFRGHQRELIRRKLHAFMQAHDLATVSALQDRVLHDSTYIEALLRALDARQVGLFDHPEYMLELRKVLAPWLRSCPAPKVWIAECTSAEDVFALAILLVEENLHRKTQIFATGANATLLSEAREGKFPLEKLGDYEKNYLLAGGTLSLANYYEQVNGAVTFLPELGNNITWAQYNLATDASFNEFELIICRGGLANYASKLRRRALQLFYDSLPTFGILSIVGSDYIEVAPFVSHYSAISPKHGLYRRIK